MAYQSFNHLHTAVVFTRPLAIFHAQATSSGGSSIERHSEIVSISLAAERRWEESVQARRQAIEAGEGHRWQQWFWLAEAYVHSGDTTRALESLDSARSKVRPPDQPRQIDSIRTVLGGFENANALQNPSSDGR